jgi:hypothetical protein
MKKEVVVAQFEVFAQYIVEGTEKYNYKQQPRCVSPQNIEKTVSHGKNSVGFPFQPNLSLTLLILSLSMA